MASDDPHIHDVPDQDLRFRGSPVHSSPPKVGRPGPTPGDAVQAPIKQERMNPGQPSTSPEPAATRSIGIDRSQIREGAEVVGSDGEWLGQVKQVRDDDFLLDRPMQRDLFVPLSVVALAGVDRIVLELSADEVGERNWPESTSV
jgi:hypothetical protein